MFDQHQMAWSKEVPNTMYDACNENLQSVEQSNYIYMYMYFSFMIYMCEFCARITVVIHRCFLGLRLQWVYTTHVLEHGY